MKYALESLKNDCKSCYKCIRNCPTKSISFSNNQASIIHDDCILCGRCYLACPQGTKQIRNDILKVKELLKTSNKVFVSIAPSFLANYRNSSIKTFKETLKKLGFYDVEETAIGATIVKRAYEQMIKKGDKDIIISSCCHAVNSLIQKHYPNCLPYLADVLSPMLAHAKDIKERYPDSYVVFIGPCIAKKDEADKDENHYVDAVLTYLELDEWLKDENVVIEDEKDEKIQEESKARLFPTAGGVLKTMDCSSNSYQYLEIDGIENCIEALKDIQNGKAHKCFIEMSSCSGSCINGPAMTKDTKALIEGYVNIAKKAGNKDFKVSDINYLDIKKDYKKINLIHIQPTEEEINYILKKMGKTSKEKELNCGSCGYSSCREKAIAIFQGKAVKEMCLPYLMEKSQSFADNIVYNTPNGLMVLNEELDIQLMNKSMCNLIGIADKKMVIGRNVTTIFSPELYVDALEGMTTRARKEYLVEYDKYVEETVIYDEKFHIIISIMRDITKEQKDYLKHRELISKSVEITNDVIEKNMRTVQEIASLLGESAAETKVALSSLKDAFKDDDK